MWWYLKFDDITQKILVYHSDNIRGKKYILRREREKKTYSTNKEENFFYSACVSLVITFQFSHHQWNISSNQYKGILNSIKCFSQTHLNSSNDDFVQHVKMHSKICSVKQKNVAECCFKIVC